jgi:hypothetical protein
MKFFSADCFRTISGILVILNHARNQIGGAMLSRRTRTMLYTRL